MNIQKLAKLIIAQVDDFEMQLKHLGAQDIKFRSGGKSIAGDFSTYNFIDKDNKYNFRVRVLDENGVLFNFDMGKSLNTIADYRNGRWTKTPAKNTEDFEVFDKFRKIFE